MFTSIRFIIWCLWCLEKTSKNATPCCWMSKLESGLFLQYVTYMWNLSAWEHKNTLINLEDFTQFCSSLIWTWKKIIPRWQSSVQHPREAVHSFPVPSGKYCKTQSTPLLCIHPSIHFRLSWSGSSWLDVLDVSTVVSSIGIVVLQYIEHIFYSIFNSTCCGTRRCPGCFQTRCHPCLPGQVGHPPSRSSSPTGTSAACDSNMYNAAFFRTIWCHNQRYFLSESMNSENIPQCTLADLWRRLFLSEGAQPWCTWGDTGVITLLQQYSYSTSSMCMHINSTHSFLRAERLFSSLTWWLGSERLTSGSESERLLGISSNSKSLLSWVGYHTSQTLLCIYILSKYRSRFWHQTCTCFLYLWAASQCRFQQVAVLPHPDSEVTVALVNRGNAAAELCAVGVAFGQHALSQLDEQMNLFLRVLAEMRSYFS